tara:strand:- start:812 stop:1906 length:1095 start_codon:yes stop_codon:yes gene_type:complete
MRGLIEYLHTEFNLTILTFCKEKNSSHNFKYISLPYKFYFLNFIWFLFKIIKEKNNHDVLFVDNRKTAAVVAIIYFFVKDKILIQDVREFYTIRESKSLKSLIGTLFEGFLIKKSNIIITANEHRARLTKILYNLKIKPLVYENRRAFPKEGISASLANKNYFFDVISESKISINQNKLNLVSTSGFTIERGCLEIVKSAEKFNKQVNLYFIGKTYGKDQKVLTDYIKKKSITNVFLFNQISLSELSVFLRNMDVGVVNYSKKNRNNIYCASGKIFEFLSLGIPVLCSDNITLSDIVSRYKCGTSNNNFNKSIENFISNISLYKKSVNNIDLMQEIENYNKEFVFSLTQRVNYKLYDSITIKKI